MTRYWVSWWSGNYEDEGCTKPPFQFWVSGQRERGMDEDRDEESICAVIDSESSEDIESLIAKHFPDYEMRFCEERASDWEPGDRFPKHQADDKISDNETSSDNIPIPLDMTGVINDMDDILASTAVVSHETAQEVIEMYWKCPLSDIESVNENGGDPISGEVLLHSVTKQGLWGFADVPNNIVHYWSGPNCDKFLKVHFLGHELMHIALNMIPETEDDDLIEEWLCEATGLVVRRIFEGLLKEE
jgi:hypothetical protein